MRPHPFLALTDSDQEEMLRTIGVGSVDGLFRELPEAVRLGRELDLEPALSEQEVFAHLAALAERNADASRELSFLGAGIYDHYVPATQAAPGTALTIDVRGKPREARVVAKPIYKREG